MRDHPEEIEQISIDRTSPDKATANRFCITRLGSAKAANKQYQFWKISKAIAELFFILII
jgi:hypothetical protein